LTGRHLGSILAMLGNAAAVASVGVSGTVDAPVF
jgi:hypothetical protein